MDVGTIWFLICPLESRLLPFFWTYFWPFLATSGFNRFFGDKTGSWGRNHMVPNTSIRKSTIVFLLSILSAISVNFRFSTGFSPIKPEVDTLRVWDLDQTRVSRVFRVEWGVNQFCTTTSGFYRKWLIGPEIRLHQRVGRTRYAEGTSIFQNAQSLPSPSKPKISVFSNFRPVLPVILKNFLKKWVGQIFLNFLKISLQKDPRRYLVWSFCYGFFFV